MIMRNLKTKGVVSLSACMLALLCAATGTFAADAPARSGLLQAVLGAYGIEAAVVDLQRGDGFEQAVLLQGGSIAPIMFSVRGGQVLVATDAGEAVLDADGNGIGSQQEIDDILCYSTAVITLFGDVQSCESDDIACVLLSVINFVQNVLACSP